MCRPALATLPGLFRSGLAAAACLAALAVLGIFVAPLRAAESDEPPAAAEADGDEADLDDGGRKDALAAANPFPRRFKAPELEGGNGWLNAAGEITLRDLRGKVVLLDFWTYCCINCMHVLPDLKYLEQKYPRNLVVIGVHSAKFENEKDSENIRRAIMRYEIEHPVVNDSDMTIWRKFGVNAWPTLVLIDPEGYYCGFISGEGNREALEQVIDRVIAYHRRKKTLDETPVRFDLERAKAPATPLRFPGKILADAPGNRLFISDSNHNRIVVASLDGQLLDVIGTGAAGRSNGAYDQASFDHPQGMALVGDTLYVADTENHMLRAVDLSAKTVRNVAGTGKQGHERRAGGDLTTTALNSPWDLAPVDGKLYVAMAGPHQLWVADLRRRSIEPYAGSGREDILNGPLAEAAMAQPSGITTDGRFLYVVDSEGSALRRVPLDPAGEMTTLVGASDIPNGRSLFEFGDRDGVGGDARLQHPLGVTLHEGTLYVADSYNHKIKRVEPDSGASRTFLGDGQPGDTDDPPRFSEPGGLTAAGETLFIADTNNHRIRVANLKTGAVATLEIAGLAPPTAPKPSSADDPEGKKLIRIKEQTVAAAGEVTFEIALDLPEGYKLNRLAPLTYRLKAERGDPLVASDELDARREIEPPEEGQTIRFRVPLGASSGSGQLRVSLSYQYCRDGTGGLCKLGSLAWAVPLTVSADSQESLIRLPLK